DRGIRYPLPGEALEPGRSRDDPGGERERNRELRAQHIARRLLINLRSEAQARDFDAIDLVGLDLVLRQNSFQRIQGAMIVAAAGMPLEIILIDLPVGAEAIDHPVRIERLR